MSKVIHISGKEALKLAERDDVLVLDVRTVPEHLQRTLPHAKLIPLDQLPKRLQELPADRSMPLFVYCEHGVRSRIACQFLSENGFENLYNLKGGMAGLFGEF